MLNKKAIAAFAAGATLLSGMAFAAPAFAAETEAPKKEECKPADAAKLTELKHAVTVAERNVSKKENALADAKDDLNAKKEAYAAKKAVADAYNNALKAYNDAKTGDKKDDTTPKQLEALKEAFAKAGKAAKAFTAADETKPFEATAKESVDDNPTDLSAGADPSEQGVKDAKHELQDAKDELQDAKDALAKAQCTPADPEHKDPEHKDPTPTPKGKDVQHTLIDQVRFAKMMLDDADDALAHAKATLKDKTAALAAATAELKARVNDLDNAKLRLNEFLASGVNDSATETRLRDAVARAEAHVTRATAAFAKANAEYNDALTKALAAVDAYNKALLDYKAVYNEAVANGVNPALLPPVVTSDPLSKNFPQVPGAKALYDEALSGKFGQEVKKILEETSSKKNDAKKADAKKSAAPLAKTGAAVALAAVAASVLAGMGAALRKIRH